MSARFNDDTRDELRDLYRVIFSPSRDRTAGNVPLYDERVRCQRCRAVLLDEARCSECGLHTGGAR